MERKRKLEISVKVVLEKYHLSVIISGWAALLGRHRRGCQW